MGQQGWRAGQSAHERAAARRRAKRAGSKAARLTLFALPSRISSDRASPVAGAFRMPQQLWPAPAGKQRAAGWRDRARTGKLSTLQYVPDGQINQVKQLHPLMQRPRPFAMHPIEASAAVKAYLWPHTHSPAPEPAQSRAARRRCTAGSRPAAAAAERGPAPALAASGTVCCSAQPAQLNLLSMHRIITGRDTCHPSWLLAT